MHLLNMHLSAAHVTLISKQVMDVVNKYQNYFMLINYFAMLVCCWFDSLGISVLLFWRPSSEIIFVSGYRERIKELIGLLNVFSTLLKIMQRDNLSFRISRKNKRTCIMSKYIFQHGMQLNPTHGLLQRMSL